MDDTTNPSDIPIVNEIAEVTYPRRGAFFAMSYLRLVAKCEAGQAIGPAGVALLAIVVTTEDQFRYRRAVDFFDDQLTPMLGLSSRKTLGVTRRKCVEEKWLHYMPGQKRRPGKYWVTIPAEFQGTPDYCDDATKMIGDTTGVNFTQEQNGIDSEKGTGSTQKREQNRLRKGGTTNPTPTPTPIPVPIPVKKEPPNPQGGSDSKKTKPILITKAQEQTELPDELDTPEFRATWTEWIAHRIEIKKPLLPMSIKKQLEMLAKAGERKAIESINQSIASGWQGVFEVKAGSIGGQKDMFSGLGAFMENTDDEGRPLKWNAMNRGNNQGKSAEQHRHETSQRLLAEFAALDDK